MGSASVGGVLGGVGGGLGASAMSLIDGGVLDDPNLARRLPPEVVESLLTGDVVEEKEAARSAARAAQAGRKPEKTAGTPSDSSAQPEVKPSPSGDVPAATSIPFEWVMIKVHLLAPAPPACLTDL